MNYEARQDARHEEQWREQANDKDWWAWQVLSTVAREESAPDWVAHWEPVEGSRMNELQDIIAEFSDDESNAIASILLAASKSRDNDLRYTACALLTRIARKYGEWASQKWAA